MKKPTLVLWDWNGTLLDDLDFSVDCLNILLHEHGYTQSYTLAQYKDIFCFPIEEYYTRAGFDFSTHTFAALAVRFMELYIPGSEGCAASAHAQQTLQALQHAGLKQVVLSASPHTTLCAQVAQRNLSHFFDELLGLGDIYAKSKVELGTQWMARSGIDAAEAVMIGDSVHDAEVAAAMGVRCILYTGGHQCAAELAKTGCTLISSLEELPTLLLDVE